MILFVVAALTAQQLTDLNKRSAACDGDKSLIGVTYASCVLDAAAVEQRNFLEKTRAALRNKVINRQKLASWQKARDRRCEHEGKRVPNYAYQNVVRARCIARSDDRLLRSFRLAHR